MEFWRDLEVMRKDLEMETLKALLQNHLRVEVVTDRLHPSYYEEGESEIVRVKVRLLFDGELVSEDESEAL